MWLTFCQLSPWSSLMKRLPVLLPNASVAPSASMSSPCPVHVVAGVSLRHALVQNFEGSFAPTPGQAAERPSTWYGVRDGVRQFSSGTRTVVTRAYWPVRTE